MDPLVHDKNFSDVSVDDLRKHHKSNQPTKMILQNTGLYGKNSESLTSEVSTSQT